MKNYMVGLILLFFLLNTATVSLQAREKKVYVITTISTLADFTKQIGKDKIEVESLAKGTQDIHYVEPRPSFISKLRQADMVVINGLTLDIWVNPLLDAAKNTPIAPGGKGFIDASNGIKPLEVPQGKVSMAHGELHPLGNPHYLMDPARAAIALKNILDGLIRVSPENAEYFKSNYNNYIKTLNMKILEWNKIMAHHKDKPVVTYHKSWTYFIKAYNLNEFGTIEPKPAIPPSPSHIEQLIKDMKEKKVKAILKEPFFPDKFPQLIAKDTNSTLLVLPDAVGAAPGTDTYITLMDYLINKVSEALK